MKRKRNLLDDKQKREIISYGKENPKLNKLLIIWQLNGIYLYLCLCTSAKCMSVELKQVEKFNLFIWSHDFRFSMSLSLSQNRQTTDCTEGGGLTREHCTVYALTAESLPCMPFSFTTSTEQDVLNNFCLKMAAGTCNIYLVSFVLNPRLREVTTPHRP